MKRILVVFVVFTILSFCACKAVVIAGETIYVPVPFESPEEGASLTKWQISELEELESDEDFYHAVAYGDYEGGRFVALASDGS